MINSIPNLLIFLMSVESQIFWIPERGPLSSKPLQCTTVAANTKVTGVARVGTYTTSDKCPVQSGHTKLFSLCTVQILIYLCKDLCEILLMRVFNYLDCEFLNRENFY